MPPPPLLPAGGNRALAWLRGGLEVTGEDRVARGECQGGGNAVISRELGPGTSCPGWWGAGSLGQEQPRGG